MPAQPISSTWVRQETSKVLESADDLASLESLVRQYSRFVFKVAYGVLRNPHDAEDVVQEVFLRVHRSRAKNVVDMRAWLASVAFRMAVDRIRQPRADTPLEDLDPTSPAADAERLAIDRQRMKHVHKLIAALPDELRYPLVLSAIEELSSPQIAEVLGISESSVRGRIFRARQILKEKLSAVRKEVMKHNDEFDGLLHDALAEYREAGPLAGMEERVLRRVRCILNGHDARWDRLWRAFAVASMAMAITAWIGLHDRVRHQTVPLHSADAQHQQDASGASADECSTEYSRKPAPGAGVRLQKRCIRRQPRVQEPGQTAYGRHQRAESGSSFPRRRRLTVPRNVPCWRLRKPTLSSAPVI